VSNVIQLPSRGVERVLTKKQLAAHLGRSERWVELRVREGMPVLEATDRYGRRRYKLRACEEWLARGRPRIVASTEDRLAALECQVGELIALVRGLRRAP
jgi:phage terminase Nu1 subunit (DNA packaging protein)